MKKIYLGLSLFLASFIAKAQFPAPYCSEHFSDGVEPITSVIFNTINQTSSATSTASLENYTTVSTTVQQGGTYTIQVKGNTEGDYTDVVAAFIDFNNNGSFTDPGESFLVGGIGSSTGTDAQVATAFITIPTTATVGAKRMRIIKYYYYYPDPCNIDGYGQAEDYTLNIVAASCNLPSNLQFNNVAAPSATLSWTGASGVSSYEYAVTTSAIPPSSGTTISATSVTVNNTPANTYLYGHVRSACTGGSFTAWVTKLLSDSCGAPISLRSGVPTAGTIVGTTQSIPAVSCAGGTSPYPQDAWFSLTADNNGSATVTITNPSNALDAIIVGYSGSCGSLTSIGCADAGLDGDNETLTLSNLTAGQTYRIRVYSWGLAGTFTITATGTALPVTGMTLSAVRNGKNVQLDWQTYTEMNNAGFEIQRSADGANFSSFLKVASKAANGNSTSAINYTAEDVKPFSGANYYRLKQTDKDGRVNYSNVVYLKGIAVSNLTLSAIYPNPTRDVLKAAVQAPAAETITFVITDMMGKAISRQTTQVISGDNAINLNVANLASGNYLLKAICNNGCETAVQKFTKQ
jgi:hypothetical protein